MARTVASILRFKLAFCLGIALFALPAPAQDPPESESKLVVYGNEPCPRGEGDDIVVCARQPESERYRIPKRLRDSAQRRREAAWATQVQLLDEISRAGLPNSCSVVGSGGQTGCTARMLRQWHAERRALEARDVP